MSLAGLQSSWSPAINSYGGGSAPTNSISGGTAPNVGSVTVQSGSGSVNVISETGSVVIQTSLNGEVLIAPNADTPTAVVGPVHYTAGTYNAADAYGTGAIVQFTDNNFYLAEGPVPVGDPGPGAGGSQFILFSGTGGSTPAAISEGTGATASSVTCAGGTIITSATGTMSLAATGNTSVTSGAALAMASSTTAALTGGTGVNITSSANGIALTAGAATGGITLTAGAPPVAAPAGTQIRLVSSQNTVIDVATAAGETGLFQVLVGAPSGTHGTFTVQQADTPVPVTGSGLVVGPTLIWMNGRAL